MGWVLWSPSLFLSCTYAITKEEMPTSAAKVNEIIKSDGEFVISHNIKYQRNLLKLVYTAQNC